jgi:nicotinamide mononucleotide adenylyltransferase
MEIGQALIDTLQQRYPAVDISLHGIQDFGDNGQWRSFIENDLPDFDTMITGNPIVKEIWPDKNIFIPSKAEVPYRGTHIRHQLLQGDRETLKLSVPDLVSNALRSIDAEKIMQDIEKLQPQPPKLAVDIIAMYE